MQVADFQTVKSRGPSLVDSVASHWNGELGFAGALIRAPLLAIFLSLCLLVMMLFFENAAPLWFNRSRQSLYIFNASALLVAGIWWCIGTFRTSNALLSKGRIASAGTIFVLAIWVSWLVATDCTSLWFDTYKDYSSVQQQEEAHKREFLNSYKSKSWSVIAVPEISRVVASGPIGVGSADALRKVLDANPSLHLLELDSSGGLVAEEYKLISIVEQHHLDTLVLNDCASACTGVFLAGINRYIGDDSWVGFHQAGYSGRPHNTEWSTAEYIASHSFYEKGVKAKFASKALNTSYYDIWYPYPIDVKRSGFATAWWSERDARYR